MYNNKMSLSYIFCNFILFVITNLGLTKNQIHARQLIFHSYPNNIHSDEPDNKLEVDAIPALYTSLESLNAPDITPLETNRKDINLFLNTAPTKKSVSYKKKRLKKKNKKKKKNLKKHQEKTKSSKRNKQKSQRWKEIKVSDSKDSSNTRKPVDIIVHIKVKD